MARHPRSSPRAPSILERPLVRFGREITGDLAAGLRREWLVTNGLGSYASGTVAGPATRRYHGLLVAALAPPVERTVLVAGAVEWLVDGDRRVPLSTHEFGDGTIDPVGYRHLESFALDGALPVWRYAAGEVLVERRVWMPHGEQATWLTFRLARGERPVRLEVSPLVVERSFHSLATARTPRVDGPLGRWRDGAPTVRLAATGGEVDPAAVWYRDFLHREERARGLDERSDAFVPGTFHLDLAPGQLVGIRMDVVPDRDEDGGDGHVLADLDAAASLDAARARQADLIARAGAIDADPVVAQLVLAADQFLVERRPAGRTVIAGYHWFNDWGRDTMIALPGLTLATGRTDEGASILRSFAPFVRDGLLPNDFPDRAGVDPGYNTADASLWYPVAIGRHLAVTGDMGLVEELLPTVRDIVDRHIAGTRFGIGMDPADGLLRAGEPGTQLTWMDARLGDESFTPRVGKPVEINALWYNALRFLATWLVDLGDPSATAYRALADRVRTSFATRFACPDDDHLADVVDGPDGDDLRLRPNQIFAIALPHPLIDGQEAGRVLDSTGRWLFTSLGLRSLSPEDPAYRGDYGGDPYRRDSGYHQGPVWTWLIGAYVEAHLRLRGDVAAARTILAPFADHLLDAGLGSVSEILDGDPPHTPRGCVAQAWGVAEVLRAWRLLDDAAEGGSIRNGRVAGGGTR
jgi:predicted glycogen debranching enzyme